MSTPVLEGGEGPRIVLLHGLGGFAEEWRLVIPKLTSDHRVVVPDLPGLGRSEVVRSDLDAASVVAWLRELIEQTCSEPPTLVGHSLGGGIAVRFAIEHPDRVSRVVLVDAASVGRPNRPAPAVLAALIRFGAGPTHANHDRLMSHVLVHPGRVSRKWGDQWPGFEGYDIDLAKDKSVSRSTGQLLRRVAGRRVPIDQLAAIDVPVAMIWGTGDRLMRFRIAERTAERMGWPLFPIDDCGHAPHIERPSVFHEALEMAMSA